MLMKVVGHVGSLLRFCALSRPLRFHFSFDLVSQQTNIKVTVG